MGKLVREVATVEQQGQLQQQQAGTGGSRACDKRANELYDAEERSAAASRLAGKGNTLNLGLYVYIMQKPSMPVYQLPQEFNAMAKHETASIVQPKVFQASTAS